MKQTKPVGNVLCTRTLYFLNSCTAPFPSASAVLRRYINRLIIIIIIMDSTVCTLCSQKLSNIVTLKYSTEKSEHYDLLNSINTFLIVLFVFFFYFITLDYTFSSFRF